MKKFLANLLVWLLTSSTYAIAETASAVPPTTVASAVTATSTVSATLSKSAAIPPPPSDQGSWVGDVITLRSTTTGIMAANSAASSVPYTALNGSVFEVVTEDAKTNKLNIKFRTGTLDGSNACVTNFLPCIFSSFFSTSIKKYTDLPNPTVVNDDDVYTVDKAAIESVPRFQHGWAFGPLIAPFKYQFTDKSFTTSPSLGPYIGYKIQTTGSSITPIISAGWIPNVTVPLANGSGTVTQSGWSMATGLIFSIEKGTTMQVGLLFGQDRLGTNPAAPYKYEGKWWMSIAVGWKFI